MSAVAETLRALASVLNASRAPWYVFGAQAVAVRGAPRATQDIDVTVIIKPGRVPQLAEALERAGLTHRFPAIKDQLLAEASVLPFTHASGMEVDLVIGASGLEELTASRATPSA